MSTTLRIKILQVTLILVTLLAYIDMSGTELFNISLNSSSCNQCRNPNDVNFACVAAQRCPQSQTCHLARVLDINPMHVTRIVNKHNAFRGQVAQGKVRLGDNFLPPASNMLSLEWDEELAFLAKCHVMECRASKMPDSCLYTDRFKNIIQNIAFVPEVGPDLAMLENLLNAWLRNALIETIDTEMFVQYPPQRYKEMANIIRADLAFVGCAYADYRIHQTRSTYLLCNYGNINDSGPGLRNAIYEIGPVCSSCPNGTTCGIHATLGLCKPQEPFRRRFIDWPEHEYMAERLVDNISFPKGAIIIICCSFIGMLTFFVGITILLLLLVKKGSRFHDDGTASLSTGDESTIGSQANAARKMGIDCKECFNYTWTAVTSALCRCYCDEDCNIVTTRNASARSSPEELTAGLPRPASLRRH